MAKAHVIVIDDEKNIRFILEKILKKNYEVHAFESGDDFLKNGANLNPSTIIIDWQMPGRSGIETLNEMRVRNLYQGVPVAMNTNMEYSSDNMKKAMEVGVTIFLNKQSSMIYTELHVESLVNLYESQRQFKEMTSLIVHSLQHNVNGWLTGIVTIGSMLPMFPEWQEENLFFDKIKQMIESSKQLHKLNEDLNTLLVESSKVEYETINLKQTVEDALSTLAYLKQNMEVILPNADITIETNTIYLQRIIYYLVLYFGKTLGPQVKILLETKIEGDELLISGRVNQYTEISELFQKAYIPNAQHGTNILSSTYIRRTVNRLKGTLVVASSEDHSEVNIRLPIKK